VVRVLAGVRRLFAACLLAGALGPGCVFGQPQIRPPEPRIAPPPPTAEPPWIWPGDVAGTWTGHYECAKTTTNVRLTVEPYGSNVTRCKASPCSIDEPTVYVNGRVDLLPPQGGAPGPSGAFTLAGTFTYEGCELRAQSWVDRRPGARMVGLKGDFSADGRSLSGVVLAEGCGRFTLVKDPRSPRRRSPSF
jgi:hypothetical protein